MADADYNSILLQTADLVRIARANIFTEDWKALRGFHNTRLSDVWRRWWWPWLMRVERRYFRAPYDSSTAYVAGDEVWFPQELAYYVALRASTGEDPADADGATNTAYWASSQRSYSPADFDVTTTYAVGAQVAWQGDNYQMHTVSGVAGTLPSDTTYWGALVDFNPYIAYDQDWETQVIGDVLSCTMANPQTTTRNSDLDWHLSTNGIQIETNVSWAWVEYRIPCPRLVGDAYDDTLTYAVGDQVYFESDDTPGNFYDCIVATSAGESPDTTPASWDKVNLPVEFEHYLQRGAAADWFASNEKMSSAGFYEGLANSERNDLQSRFAAFQHGLRRTTVHTR